MIRKSGTWPRTQSYATRMTKRLEAELLAKGFNPQEFCQYFQTWKQEGAEDWFFGKDNFYSKPLMDGEMVLRHVHLAPGEADTDESGTRLLLPTWDQIWFAGWNKERVSNTALIYAQDATQGYLLLHVVWAPRAHPFARMQDAEDSALMMRLRDEAAAFIFNGEISA